MKLKNIIHAIAHVIKESFKPEAAETPYWRDGSNRWEWRRLESGMGDTTEFSPEDIATIQRRAYRAWCRNPLAGQIVNLTTWFVMGKGIGFSAKDERVGNILKEFWNSPENNMQMMQHWMSNELQIFGEIFIRIFTNPIDGSVRLAMVDPREVIDIATDWNNVREPVAYLREYTRTPHPDEWIENFRGDGKPGLGRLKRETVREVIDADEIIHVRVNSLSNSRRGISELYRVLRWLDAYERWLEDRMKINQARGAFAYLRKVPTTPSRAAGPFETDSSGKYITPKPGSILVVHQDEEWQVLSPSIGADDAKEDGRAIKLMIAAGSCIFEHYFGDPSTGNLATARSMELPMLRKFENRQRLFESIFAKIFQRVIRSAIEAGTLPPDADTSFDINFPPIMPDDVAMLTKTLIDQVNSGLISRDSARRMIPWIADPSGEKLAIDRETK